MGDTSTKWGKLRAEMGHPDPFKINYMAIGNEDCGKPYYTTNYIAFYEALHIAYPDLMLIANCDMEDSAPTMMYDYHIYDSPEAMIAMHNTFDTGRSLPLSLSLSLSVSVSLSFCSALLCFALLCSLSIIRARSLFLSSPSMRKLLSQPEYFRFDIQFRVRHRWPRSR